MSSLFDAVEADRLKEEGMARAAEWTDYHIVDKARHFARLACKIQGEATIDDVYRLLEQNNIPFSLGAASGSVFKGTWFEFTGEWRKSTRTSNHSRYIRVWRLKT